MLNSVNGPDNKRCIVAKMTMWFFAAFVVLIALLGVYELATAPGRAHKQRVEAVTREANARIAKDQAAQERKWAAAPKAPSKKMPDIEQVFDQVCASLRLAGSTTCNLHVKLWSSSYIDATFPGSLSAARVACATAAQAARTPERPLLGWQIKMFSPMGNDRPITVCTL